MRESGTDQDIYTSATECSRLFDLYLKALGTADGRRDVATELLGRFDLWAAYVGACAPPKASLDARLVDDSGVRDMVLELLAMVQRNLRHELHLRSAESSPELQNPAPTDDDSPLIIGLDAVDAALGRLHSLAVAIRRSAAPRYQQRVVADAAAINPLEESYCIQLVKRRFPHASESLVRHIGRSIHVRGRSIHYRQRHNEKIRETRQQREFATPPEAQAAPKGKATDSSIDSSTQGFRHVIAMSETNVSTLNGEELHRRIRLGSRSLSRASRGSSIRESQSESWDYPKKPSAATGASTEGPCLLCSQPLKLGNLTDEEWQDHVNEDVEPYVCISEGCRDPFRYFATARSWKDHMQRMHGQDWAWSTHAAVWLCDIDHSGVPVGLEQTEFNDKETFTQHLSKAHGGRLSRSQIFARARRARTILNREPFTCPFCDRQPDEIAHHISERPYDLLSGHIARHIKALGFLSLSYLDLLPAEKDPKQANLELTDSGWRNTGNDGTTAPFDDSGLDGEFDDVPPTEAINNGVEVEGRYFPEPILLNEPVIWPPLPVREPPRADRTLERFAAAWVARQSQAGKIEPTIPRETEPSSTPLATQSAKDIKPTPATTRGIGSRWDLVWRNPKDKWHRQLLASGAAEYLLGEPGEPGEPSFESFPFSILSATTDAYITRKKLIPNTLQCDAILVEMTLEHSYERGGVKEVAILACLHALSHAAAIALLASFRDECSTAAAERFLRCLVLSHYASDSVISSTECRAGQSLLWLLAGHDLFATVKQLFESLSKSNPIVLSVVYISSILSKVDFHTKFNSHLGVLKEERRFMSLYNAVSWLRPLYSLPNTSAALALITLILPQGNALAAWRPNYLRVMSWEGGNFTDVQRKRLYPVFDLEGPGPTGHDSPSLKESPACFDSLCILNQDHALVEQLLSLLDRAQHIPGERAADFFIFTCIENRLRNTVDRQLLSFVQDVFDTQNNECIHAIHLWLSNHSGFNNRMVALVKLLPVLGPYPALWQLLGSDISSDVVEVMSAARAEFAKLLDTGVPEHLALIIQALGRAIIAAPWLHSSLPSTLLGELRAFPSQETMHEILDSLQEGRAPEERILQYLSVVIGGRPGDASSLLCSIQGNLAFWRNLDQDRAALALVLENLPYVDKEVYEACRQRILVEDLFFIRDLLTVTRLGGEVSCVNFARLLHRRIQLPGKVDDCWLGLLFSALLDHRDDTLAWAAETLSPDQWFEWIQDLRALFPHSDDDRLSVTDLGLTPMKYDWWHLLSTTYRPAIKKLASLHKGRDNFSWLWFQHFPGITALLHLLQEEEQDRRPLENFLLSFLVPGVRETGLICECLHAINHASLQGQQVFESVRAQYKQGSQTLVVSPQQWSTISEDDRAELQTGLQAFGQLLGDGILVDEEGDLSEEDVSKKEDASKIAGLGEEETLSKQGAVGKKVS